MITAIDQETKYDTIVLERMRVAAQTSVAANVLADAELVSFVNQMTDSLIYRLESHVLRHHIADEYKDFDFSFTFPASGWHRFKLRKWPQWLIAHRLLRKVKYVRYDEKRTIEVRSWATFPECTMRYPKELGEVRIMQEVGVRPTPRMDHRMVTHSKPVDFGKYSQEELNSIRRVLGLEPSVVK